MGKERITISVDDSLVRRLDQLVDKQNIRNRSHAVETILDGALASEEITTAVVFIGGANVAADQSHTIDAMLKLREEGITKFFIILGFYAKQAQKVLGDGTEYGLEFIYHQTEKGSGGGLKELTEQLPEQFALVQVSKKITFDWKLIDHYHHKFIPAVTLLQVSDSDWIGIGEKSMLDDISSEFVLCEDLFKDLIEKQSLILIPDTDSRLRGNDSS